MSWSSLALIEDSDISILKRFTDFLLNFKQNYLYSIESKVRIYWRAKKIYNIFTTLKFS